MSLEHWISVYLISTPWWAKWTLRWPPTSAPRSLILSTMAALIYSLVSCWSSRCQAWRSGCLGFFFGDSKQKLQQNCSVVAMTSTHLFPHSVNVWWGPHYVPGTEPHPSRTLTELGPAELPSNSRVYKIPNKQKEETYLYMLSVPFRTQGVVPLTTQKRISVLPNAMSAQHKLESLWKRESQMSKCPQQTGL